ncbi:hypothetical protein BBO_04997 [Beauveria brongniartii RCEF 3172]|uniref:Uncharacterized protein n=1 Tax=Beauveria brongniartii RCEF 3172 TaxID=1081107 RepID=A0A167DFT6_9HYPO|nr:hypothetical protein BBO_04997 [Beauveria brongniartii RCEF 3172]
MPPPVAFSLAPSISSPFIQGHPEHAATGLRWQPSSFPMLAFGHDTASVPLAGLNIFNQPLGHQTASPTTSDCSAGSPAKKSTSTCFSGSSLSRRRSVSSMKGLMPLTLSASASSYTSSIFPQDSLEQRIDDYLPELLARDLELGSDIFAAKSMTAGTPSHSVTAEYMARAKAAGRLTNRPEMAGEYQPASSRVQVLQSIEERDSIATFLERQGRQQYLDNEYPDISDVESFSSEDNSSSMPPPSFRYHRNMSIVTEATSLTDSVWKPSPQPSPRPLEPCRRNWIHGDSDEDSEIDQDSIFGQEIQENPSPRASTPLIVVDNESPLLDCEESAAAARRRFLHRKSHSLTEVPTSEALIRAARLRHATAHHLLSTKQANRTNMITQEFQRDTWPGHFTAEQPGRVSPVPHSTPRVAQQKHRPRRSRSIEEGLGKRPRTAAAAAAVACPPAPRLESPPMSASYASETESEEDDVYSAKQQTFQRGLEADYSRTTPPESPRRNFVTLAHSAAPYVLNFGGDELARVVPLPPDVIETLRVSVACFPETILLSSSLTIDTIRSYSKKMRHPGTDFSRLSSSPEEAAAKKSLWRRVNPLKRAASSKNLRHNALHSANESRAGSIGGGGADAQKAWSAIQNVFGTCSEYICDALFAHIMAYNYVSALLARSAAATCSTSASSSLVGRHASGRRGGRRAGGPSWPADQKQDDIPNKAASLLGLSSPGIEPAGAGARHNRLVPRTSNMTMTASSSSPSRPWSRDELLPCQLVPSAVHEAPVRTVHEGLYKCIVRLIATARLMSASGRTEEPIADADATDADLLFLRSLCEIVRLVEETP